jgi:hypothetical protein
VLFAAVILSAIGYTLVYAGVKGDGYKIGGASVYKKPWLPIVAVFSGKSTTTAAAQITASDSEDFFANLAAQFASGGSSGSSPAPASPVTPATPAPASPNFTTPGSLPKPPAGYTFT